MAQHIISQALKKNNPRLQCLPSADFGRGLQRDNILSLLFLSSFSFCHLRVFSELPKIVELHYMVAPSNIDVCSVCCPHTSSFIFSGAAPRVNVDNLSIHQKFNFFLKIHKKSLFYCSFDPGDEQTHVFRAGFTKIHHVVWVFF